MLTQLYLDYDSTVQGNWWIQIIVKSTTAITMRNARFCALHNYRISLLFMQILLLIPIVNIFLLHTFWIPEIKFSRLYKDYKKW
jgi:hypothetical protein